MAFNQTGSDIPTSHPQSRPSSDSTHPGTCTAHPAAAATDYCLDHYILYCVACSDDHEGCDTVPLDGDAVTSTLHSKSAAFRAVAGTASELSTRIDAEKTIIQRKCDDDVDLIIDVVAELKAKLDELCSSRVAEIRKLAAESQKQLDVLHDELLVRASQLSAAAAMCDSAVTKPLRNQANTLASLCTYDALSIKFLPDLTALPTKSNQIAEEMRLLELRNSVNAAVEVCHSCHHLVSSLIPPPPPCRNTTQC